VFAVFYVWGWLLIHATAILAGLALFLLELRAPAAHPPAEPRVWLMVFLVAVVAVIGTSAGRALAFAD